MKIRVSFGVLSSSFPLIALSFLGLESLRNVAFRSCLLHLKTSRRAFVTRSWYILFSECILWYSSSLSAPKKQYVTVVVLCGGVGG